MATRARSGVPFAIFVIGVAGLSAGAHANSIRPSFTEPSESVRLASANLASSNNAVFRSANYESARSSLLIGSSRSSSASNGMLSSASNGVRGNAVTEVVSVNRRHHHPVATITGVVVTQASGVPDSGNTFFLLFGSLAVLIALRRFRAANCPPA